MQKKLFTQIRNEWRGNLWLALELLVVSVVMWYIVDLLYCNLATYLEPRGFDTEHCYLVKMGLLTDKSPDYRPDADEKADVLARRGWHWPDGCGTAPRWRPSAWRRIPIRTMWATLPTVCRMTL